ncbi:MAG: TonB-dependent receptor [Gammaproteobacteria bacterium]|nr:TonB-dependent receptor [Gammaproteobacteria bacterium]
MKMLPLCCSAAVRPWLRGLMLTALGATLIPLSMGSVASEAVLEEVLVTATRRGDVALRTTPVAVTALTGREVDNLAPRHLGDMAVMVPNFSAGQPAGFNAASFAMRGVGQTAIIVYADSHVGVTVDDFVVPHIQTQLLEMFDIEQVEVLRGPQGTLFGKNTTGGVVNVRTKRPELDSFSLDARGKIGSWGRREGRFAVNVPVNDQLALRAAGVYLNSDGYFRNGKAFGPVVAFTPNHPDLGATGAGDGSKVGGDDSFSGRIKALWEPNENFSALLQYEHIRDRGDSPPSVNTTPADPRMVFNALGFSAPTSGDVRRQTGITNRDDLLMEMSKGHRVDVDGYYLNIDWHIPGHTISSVTGYRDQKSRLPSTYPGEAGPISLFDANRADDRDTFQQEIRIASDSAGPLSYVGGVFYQEDDTTFCVIQALGFLDLFGLGEQFFGDPTFFDNNPQILCNRQKADNYALFGDVTYDVNERLSLGAGLRWTNERKRWTGRNQVFIQALDGGFDPDLNWQTLGNVMAAADFDRFPTGVVSDSKRWKELTWRATASYMISDELYSYFTYARGFKSGAYNDQTGTSGVAITPATAAPTDPETADSFEVGLKFDLLGGRMRLDLTGFYVIYDDAQRDLVAQFQNPFGGTFQETRFFNAAEVTAGGMEAELTALLTENLMVRANVGWLRSKYDSFEADTNFDGIIDTDLSDRDVNRAPKIQGGVDVRYTWPLRQGDLELGVNVSYEDKSIFIYSPVAEELDGFSDSRTLMNASLTFTDAQDRYFIRAFGLNLTDKRYRIGELPVADLWSFATYGQPRTLGLEFGVLFSR